MRWSTWFSLALPLVLVACDESPPSPSGATENVGQTEEAFTNVCPPATTVSGIDIASFQHPGGAGINWGSVATAEKFVIIKATENTGYVNAYYAGDATGARAAGLHVGAYHFLAPSSQTGQSGAAQADYFAAHANVQPADLPPMLDVETSVSYGSVLPSVADVVGFLTEVEVKTGRKPLIYVGYYTLQSLGNPASLSTYLINIPSYGACPNFPANYPLANLVVWQDSSTKAVPGITGNVDHDVFYGDMAKFLSFANASTNYGAQFVSQTWPLASTTMTMTVNQSLPAGITLKNIGTKTWDSNTKLGTTQPRDRSSVFVAPDWLAPNRPSHDAGTTAPGQNADFKFTFHAPNTPGMYDEFFGVVQEGTAWFSDPGEGGPADNVIEAKIQVNEAQYHGQFVSQTFPTLQAAPIMMSPGQTMDGTITIKNVGTSTWKAGTTKLAPTPRDMPSPLAGAAWLTNARVSSPTADVAPGASFAFPVQLTAGAAGDYTQTFSLVEESVTWFADAPLGGGPPDDLIAVHVIVGGPTSSTATGATGSSAGGAGATGGVGGGNGTGGSGSGTTTPKKGCSCRAVGADEDGGATGTWILLAASVTVWGRSRRRTNERRLAHGARI